MCPKLVLWLICIRYRQYIYCLSKIISVLLSLPLAKRTPGNTSTHYLSSLFTATTLSVPSPMMMADFFNEQWLCKTVNKLYNLFHFYHNHQNFFTSFSASYISLFRSPAQMLVWPVLAVPSFPSLCSLDTCGSVPSSTRTGQQWNHLHNVKSADNGLLQEFSICIFIHVL